MNPSYHESRDVHALFEALLEGSLTPAQARELDALLVRDPQVRLRYVEHVQLHASLAAAAQERPATAQERPAVKAHPAEASTVAAAPVVAQLPLAPHPGNEDEALRHDSAGEVVLPPGVIMPPALPGTGLFQSLPLLLFTLLVFGGGTALGVYYRHNQQWATVASTASAGKQPPAEAKDRAQKVAESAAQDSAAATASAEATDGEMGLSRQAPFATLVKVNGCKWGACTLPTQTGSRLSAGLLRLDTGKAQITFDNGARLYLQGPAVFYLYSPSRTHLQSGKLVANVPEQAIGFTIETQKAEIVDLGTEFGVNVATSGDTEVQVLDGEVEVGAAPASPDPQRRLQEPEYAESESTGIAAIRQRLLVGEARRIGSPTADWQRVDYTPDLYRQLRPKVRRTPESPWWHVFTDDFDDNYLDPDKWRVSTDSIASGTPQIREVDGRILLVDRGRLVTANQYDPVRLGGLRITGQWTFKTPEDIFDVVVRTDAVPGGDGLIQEGMHFRAWMERTTSHIGIFGTGRSIDHPPAFGDILINPGDVFNFEILDVPGGMSLRLWEASGSGAEAHVHTIAANPADSNFVVFHNRNRGKNVRVAFLDNLVFEQGNGNVCMNADGIVEVKSNAEKK